MVTDRDRRDLFAALEDSIGSGPADTLMASLPPVGWANLARQSDLVAVRGEIAEVRGEIAEVCGEIAQLRAEMKSEMAELRSELKGEMARLFPKLVVAQLGTTFGFGSLLIAALAVL